MTRDAIALSGFDEAISASVICSGGSSSVSRAPPSGSLAACTEPRGPRRSGGRSPARAPSPDARALRASGRSGRTRAGDPPRRFPARDRAPRSRRRARALRQRPPPVAPWRVPFAGVVEQIRDRPIQARRRGSHQAGLGVERDRAPRRMQPRALQRSAAARSRRTSSTSISSISVLDRSTSRRRVPSARLAAPARRLGYERARGGQLLPEQVRRGSPVRWSAACAARARRRRRAGAEPAVSAPARRASC